MIIDAHTHVHDPLQSQLDAMDRAGIDRSVLFLTRVHPERATGLTALSDELGALTRAMAGSATDGLAVADAELRRALAAAPERFIGFGSLPLRLPLHEVAPQVQRLVDDGLHGIGELTPPPGRFDLLEPVVAAAADHPHLPVVVHGAAPTTADDLRQLADIARRHPRVPLVISQMGGLHWMTAVELVREVPSLLLELSTPPMHLAVRVAVEELQDRALFGSDAPYGDPLLTRLTVEHVVPDGDLRDAVLGGTLQRLLDV